jgi:hypothetical protein
MEFFISSLLDKMAGVTKPQRKFMVTLLLTILLMRGKVNFRNLSRYSELSEKTYSRQFRKSFDFVTFNRAIIEETVPTKHDKIGAMDCSYIPKSGKKTYGLDNFYDSCHKQTAKGLEVSNLSVIDVTANTGYTLSSRQTPPQAELEKMFTGTKSVVPEQASTECKITRMDFYSAHLTDDAHHLPAEVHYIAADGYYAKIKFVTAVRQTNRHLIAKFRCDANLRHLYTGPQKKRGARRKYEGKVKFNDLSRFEYVAEIEPAIHLYTAVVNSVRLKRNVRLVYLLNTRNKNKPRYALLFCTDTELEPETIYRYFKARFQIEFVFRDAKQFTGLGHSQARLKQSLHFHFNASFTALNLAKADAQQTFKLDAATPFSMATQKIIYFNQHFLDRFISILDLDPTLINNSPVYQSLSTYGAISTNF